MNKYLMAASDISLDPPQKNEIYFSVTMRMLTTEVNLNGVRLTSEFIEDIANHAEEYTCMPLCADVDRLAHGYDIGLTHMYDEQENMFKAPQIGSFYEVHKVEDEHGISLVGTARINKRNADVTEKIVEMFRQNKLKFSFEIWASDIREEDGVIVVDAAEGNRLTAMAIVTTPAQPAAVALNLAADVDMNTYRERIWQLIERDERVANYLWMGLDYSVIQRVDDGKLYRIDYEMRDGELVKTDEYEVVFAKPEEVNNEMDNEVNTQEQVVVDGQPVEEVVVTTEEIVDTNTVIPEVAEAKDDEVKEEETVVAEVTEETEPEAEVEPEPEADPAAELKAEIEALKAELEKYREAERKAQMAQKSEAARKYAEREGLNLEAESVKTAIENADYEALAAEVMAKPVEPEKDESYRVVAEMNMNPFGNMFDKAN